MTRLDNIVIHQRSSRARDALFAVVVAFVAAVSVTSVSTAVHAASTNIVSR